MRRVVVVPVAVLALFVAVMPAFAGGSGGAASSTEATGVTHVRWVITDWRNPDPDENPANSIQVADLVLLNDGVPLPDRGDDPGIVVTDPGGSSPRREGPEEGYDGDPETKWLDFEFAARGRSVLVIEFPAPVTFDGYSWITANDAEERDPVSWRLEVSADGESWKVVDVRSGVDVTLERFEEVGPFSLDGPGSEPVVTSPVLSCDPSPVQAGRPVSCTVSGGDPGVEILWRAAYNPVFAQDGVTLDASGAGTSGFVVPAAALGRTVTVELVEWLPPVSLGVAGAPVPLGVDAGEGPPPPRWTVTFVLLVLAGGALLRRVPATTVAD